jgi:outer membrane receptor protein involved in Fe transport
MPLGGTGYEGRFSTSATYRPEVIAARTSATTTFPAESLLMVRASLAIQSPDHWTASVFVDNLTNDDGLSIDAFSPRWNTYIRPRTIGAQVEYAF